MSSRPLRNAKHEKFALLLAAGCTVVEAYEKAGFRPHRQNAFRLRKRDDVRERVEAIMMQQSAAVIGKLQDSAVEAAYTRRDAMRESLAALNLAHAVEQPGAAVAAVVLRSKLNGLLVERKEVGGPGAFSEVSDDELRQRLLARVERLGLPKPDASQVVPDAIDVESEAVTVETSTESES